jgi:hypothetical protein
MIGMKTLQSTFWQWLPYALIATFMSGLVYVAVQQNYRQNANDPQIELAEDASAILATGQPPEIFGSNASVDMSKSLVPFIIVYDKTGKVLNGTASLKGTIPVPPMGVFENADTSGQNRLTWEPEEGIRIATVIAPYKAGTTTSGYVLAGRSLREVEKRTSTLMLYVFVAWAIALASTFIIVAMQPEQREV